MRLGYACINLSISGSFTTCRLNKVQEQGWRMVKAMAMYNLNRTETILKWNISKGILLYRLTSDMIPFASHEILDGWEWWQDEELAGKMAEIKNLVQSNNVRLTIHPGQYNVLNSGTTHIVAQTLKNLEYEERLLTSLGGTDMILHVGVGKNYKEIFSNLFVERFRDLPDSLKKVLRIENDDKVFNAYDVLDICDRTGATMMYDLHHDICNPSIGREETLEGVLKYWGDRIPKIHLSSGRDYKSDRAHADYIHEETWKEFRDMFGEIEVDAMLETKMKDFTVLRTMGWL